MEWTKDGWPVLANPNQAEWQNGGMQDYDYLRHYENPIMWAKWEPGFEGGTLMTTTAVDQAYEITAKFRIDGEGKGGLYLFYNEEANLGISSSMPEFMIRISNNCNKASLWISDNNGLSWKEVYTDVDVSGFHHNNYKGFFALRPAVLTAGSAQMTSFDYRPID